MKKNTHRNLLLAIILMLTTFCISYANVVKDTLSKDNNKPQENNVSTDKKVNDTDQHYVTSGEIPPQKKEVEEKIMPRAGDVYIPPKKNQKNKKRERNYQQSLSGAVAPR